MNASDSGAVLSTESSHGYMYVPDQDSPHDHFLLKQPKAYQTDPDDLLFLFLLGGGGGGGGRGGGDYGYVCIFNSTSCPLSIYWDCSMGTARGLYIIVQKFSD